MSVTWQFQSQPRENPWVLAVGRPWVLANIYQRNPGKWGMMRITWNNSDGDEHWQILGNRIEAISRILQTIYFILLPFLNWSTMVNYGSPFKTSSRDRITSTEPPCEWFLAGFHSHQWLAVDPPTPADARGSAPGNKTSKFSRTSSKSSGSGSSSM